MATYTCRTCGPLSPLDTVDVTDYDIARGAIMSMRCCVQCNEPVQRVD